MYHEDTSTVMQQGIQNQKMHAISITKNKHKHVDRTQMIDYIPSYNFQTYWTTGNHYCIPLTPNCCKFWKIWTRKMRFRSMVAWLKYTHGGRHQSVNMQRNVSSGKEAPTDFNLWQEDHNLELKNSNVSNT